MSTRGARPVREPKQTTVWWIGLPVEYPLLEKVWEVSKGDVSKYAHPTQKPPVLLAIPNRNSNRRGDTTADSPASCSSPSYYILPAPYNQHTAFLPFLMEEFYDANNNRHYIVSRLTPGFHHDTFIPGVEITDWSGVPIDQAVAINADREAGSNKAARYVRGLDAMTVRPMAMSLPPAEQWVIVGYCSNSQNYKIQLYWQVNQISSFNESLTPAATGKFATANGQDINMELTNNARKVLFARNAIDLSKKAADLRVDTVHSRCNGDLKQDVNNQVSATTETLLFSHTPASRCLMTYSISLRTTAAVTVTLRAEYTTPEGTTTTSTKLLDAQALAPNTDYSLVPFFTASEQGKPVRLICRTLDKVDQKYCDPLSNFSVSKKHNLCCTAI
ncbi:hypothetical protein [Paenibacillus albidus]|uniref:hypothetical protein n=1 Tax=Paenibacillus albidus TaxID=2041023 RepID=UPI0016640809|nr:hypothetical protein [Paenibacillus albidus]